MSLDARIQSLPAELQQLAREVSPRRLARVYEILDARLGGVAVVAEAVHRRHNVSAILRSAEGFGVHEAHLVCAHFQPSPGAAKGAERWLDLQLHAETTPCLTELKERGFRVYTCDIREGALSPEEVPVDQPLALLFGAELAGVSEEASALADGCVYIPMAGITQSLNVSAAAAVVLNRVCARRRAYGDSGPTKAQRLALVERFIRREKARKKSKIHLYRSES